MTMELFRIFFPSKEIFVLLFCFVLSQVLWNNSPNHALPLIEGVFSPKGNDGLSKTLDVHVPVVQSRFNSHCSFMFKMDSSFGA